MDKIPCPGCRTPLGPEMTSCPICLRPRSKYEITRAYAHLREEDSRRRRLPFKIAGWVLLAAAAGYGVWHARAPLLSAASAVRAKASRLAEESMDPKNLVKRGPEAPAASTGTYDAPAGGPAAAPEAAASPPGATPAAPPSGAPEPPAPDPKRQAVQPAVDAGATGPVRLQDLHLPTALSPSQWALYGRAYDLVTLKPASNAALAFSSSFGGTMATVTTDNVGRYAVVLPRLQEGSISVTSADARFATTVLCEPDIPYLTLPAEDRRSMARSAADGDVRPAALVDPTGDASLSRDLFLAPAR